MTERTCHVLLGLVLAIAFGIVLTRGGLEPVTDRGKATQETAFDESDSVTDETQMVERKAELRSLVAEYFASEAETGHEAMADVDWESLQQTEGSHSVRGRLIAPSGAPVALAKVCLERFVWSRTDGTRYKTTAGVEVVTSSDFDGTFAFEGIPAGPCMVGVTHPDFFLLGERDIDVQEDLDLGDLKLQSAGKIRGVVLKPNGVPATGGSVAISWAARDWPFAPMEEEGRWQSYPIVSGQFEIPGLPPGRYQLIARDHQHTAERSDRDIHVWADSVTETELQLRPSARVSGILQDGSGRGVAGIQIELQNEQPFPVLDTERHFETWTDTGQDGTFDSGPIPAGTYRVAVRWSPAEPARVHVMPGQALGVRLEAITRDVALDWK
ncbi:MAG: carboxypeptidase-like regulatory domain-containing protein [Planctomycetota bacterium]